MYLGERPVVSASTGAEAWALWQEHTRAHGDTPTKGKYARNVRGWGDADHAETNGAGSLLLISRLTCSLTEGQGRVVFADGSRIREIYGASEATERYNCNFGLNAKFAASLQDQQLKFTAFDATGEVRAFELVDYPFYIGTLYQPERAALEGNLHSLISAFVKAAVAGAA